MGVVLTDESEIRNDLIIGCCYPLVEDGASGCACILWVEWNDEELAAAVVLGLIQDRFNRRIAISHCRVKVQIALRIFPLKIFGDAPSQRGRDIPDWAIMGTPDHRIIVGKFLGSGLKNHPVQYGQPN